MYNVIYSTLIQKVSPSHMVLMSGGYMYHGDFDFNVRLINLCYNKDIY